MVQNLKLAKKVKTPVRDVASLNDLDCLDRGLAVISQKSISGYDTRVKEARSTFINCLKNSESKRSAYMHAFLAGAGSKNLQGYSEAMMLVRKLTNNFSL